MWAVVVLAAQKADEWAPRIGGASPGVETSIQTRLYEAHLPSDLAQGGLGGVAEARHHLVVDGDRSRAALLVKR